MKEPSSESYGHVTTMTHSFQSVANDARLLMVGGSLRRPYKGREIVVRVLPRGFEYEGQVYRSLSAVAKAVTDKHWNGFLAIQPIIQHLNQERKSS